MVMGTLSKVALVNVPLFKKCPNVLDPVVAPLDAPVKLTLAPVAIVNVPVTFKLAFPILEMILDVVLIKKLPITLINRLRPEPVIVLRVTVTVLGLFMVKSPPTVNVEGFPVKTRLPPFIV